MEFGQFSFTLKSLLSDISCVRTCVCVRCNACVCACVRVYLPCSKNIGCDRFSISLSLPFLYLSLFLIQTLFVISLSFLSIHPTQNGF